MSTLSPQSPCNLRVLHYEYVPDILELRGPHRAGHIAAAKKLEDDGKLVLAGAMANPVDSAMFIFKDVTDSEIKQFVEDDPYFVNGLVKSWRVREWTAVVGTGKV